MSLHPAFAASSGIDLSVVFRSDCIVELPEGATNVTAIGALIDVLVRTGRLAKEGAGDALRALLERERFGATGLGRGLAIPHLRSRSVSEPIGAAGLARLGIDFGSLDSKPTHLVLLLISPFEQRELHIGILSRIASMVSDRADCFRIRSASKVEEIQDLLRFRHTSNWDSGEPSA